MEARQLRDKANEALNKGRFAQAAELFEEYCQREPKDFQTRVRLGDVWAKMGEKARATVAYQAAAEGFAREGFLPRAIAVSKLILELDPSHQGVQQMLADLYARRSGSGGTARQVVPKPAMHIELPTHVDEALGMEVSGHAIPGFLSTSYAHPTKASTPPVAKAVEPVAEPAPATRAVAPSEPVTAQARAPTTMDIEVVVVDLDEPNSEPAETSHPALEAQAVPPGMRPRGAATPPPAPHVQSPVPGRAPVLEPESGSDSLLHAVERAAMSGLAREAEATAGLEDTEEPAIVLGEELPAPLPSPGALPEIPLFSDLPPDAFIALFERCPLRRFPEGARILEQGSRGEAFYVICQGSVRIIRQTEAESRELAVLREGAFFGEMALLSGAPRSASVVGAAEETQVLEISAPVLADLSRRFPQVARALRRFCRQRLLSNVVSTSALFESFGRKDRRELVERFRAREVRRGDTLIQEGQQVDGLYVVLSGEVVVSKGGQSLARLREGELFGEMSLLQKTPATATVTAARKTSLMRLPREDFDTLILTHPQILALVSELTETRQRRTVEVLIGERAKSGESAESFEELMILF
jgi:CRP-like cAMP-binding protein